MISQIVAIINATDDSFSGDGVHQSSDWQDTLTQQCDAFYHAGGRYVDIGAESTRPGAIPITADEEQQRLAPILQYIRVHYPDMIIGVDTMKASVADFALQHGAQMINDVTGLYHDSDMTNVIKHYDVPIVLMHNWANWGAYQHHQHGASYDAQNIKNFSDKVMSDIDKMINHALQHHLKESQIIIDPGIGFGKTIEQNLILFHMIDDLKSFGYPLYYGASRKSFIGRVLQRDNPQDRLGGTAATVALCLQYDIDYIRVHDAVFFQDMAVLYQRLIPS